MESGAGAGLVGGGCEGVVVGVVDGSPAVAGAAPMSETVGPLPWHVIAGEDLLAMFRAVRDGADPEAFYWELYANSEDRTEPEAS